MKILQVVNNLDCGGAEKLVIALAEKLNQRGIDSDIACLGQEGELAAEAKAKGLQVLSLNKREGFSLSVIWRLAKLIRKNKYDLVHTHNFAPLIYGGIAARLAGKKVINTRHGRARKVAHRFIWGLHSMIVAISGDAETEMLKYNCLGGIPTQVIYNGIDVKKYTKIDDGKWKLDKRRELRLESEDKVIGIVARLAKEKDHATLLRAVRILLEKIENGEGKGENPISNIHSPFSLKLIIVGDGVERGKLENLAKELGIEDRVKFLGFRNDIPDLMNIFDVFVLSSTTEGVSLTLLEAMAAGKPIVATDVGGNPEVVIHGETGLLVPAKDPEQMAEAILSILENPEKAKKMGENGRERVEKHFSLGKMVAEYERVYKEVGGKT